MPRKKARKALTPAAIDDLTRGRICDPESLGLRIEVLPSGKKRWKYRRRLLGSDTRIKMHFGFFPNVSIADAREWASKLNEQIDAGIDPREALRLEESHTTMTVARAHALYMMAVKEGLSSSAKRANKPPASIKCLCIRVARTRRRSPCEPVLSRRTSQP
jgi:Arm domain-containing DNA-binding protein